MLEEKFKRQIEHPYWCVGSPLKWTTPESIGIAQFAQDGKVGLFNLAWWLVNRREPPPVEVYRNTNIMWAILVAPTVTVARYSLEHHASLMTQREFCELVRDAGPSLRTRVEKQGMQWGTLKMLASQTSKEL